MNGKIKIKTKINIESIKKILIIISLTSFLHCTGYSSYVEGNYVMLRNISLIALVMVVLLGYKMSFSVIKGKIFILWLLFTGILFLSELITGVNRIGIDFILVPFIYFIIIPQINDLMNCLLIASWLSGVILIINSILVNPNVTVNMYSGIYSNPNTFGGSIALFSIASILATFLTTNKRIKLLMVISSILASYFVLISFCRTAIISLIISIMIILLFWFINNKKSKYTIILIFIICLGIVILIYINYSNFIQFIISHVYKWDNSTDISSDRFELWKIAFRNFSIFGFNSNLIPHNQFISITLYYGIIVGLLFIIINIICIIYLGKNKFINEKDYIICVIFFSLYFVFSFFEDSFGFTGREWICIGYIIIGYINKNSVKERVS